MTTPTRYDRRRRAISYSRRCRTCFHELMSPSFGSLQYTPTKNQILILLDVLDAQSIPYLLAKGHPPNDIVEVLPSRVAQSSGRGLLCDWVPQVAVLSHPATLAFLSHGGSNSAMESLMCGVPMSELGPRPGSTHFGRDIKHSWSFRHFETSTALCRSSSRTILT